MTARKTASRKDSELARELGRRLLNATEDWAACNNLQWEAIRKISRIVLIGMLVTQPKLNPGVSGEGDSS